MNIGIDIRALGTPPKTGVGEFITELLNAIFSIDHENEYLLFYNAYKNVSANIPYWKQPNVHYAAPRWPNRLLNGSLLFLNRPRLDEFIMRHCEEERGTSDDVAIPRHSKQRRPKNQGIPTLPRPGRVARDDAAKLDIFFSPNLNFLSLSLNVKHILLVHDLAYLLYPQFFTPRQRLWHNLINPKRQCERANVIFTPSENTRRDIMDYYKINGAKIKVLYPGLPSLFKTEQGVGDKTQIIKKYNLPKKFILFLGTVEPRKNIIALIEAFEHFVLNSPTSYQLPATSYSLIIAGSPGWNNKHIYERANRSPLRDRIRFLGYVSPEEKPTLYAAADLFVYPSFYEGFGFPVLEAMSMGIPVITSNRSSLPEVTGSSAYLVNPHRPEEIAQGMRELLTNGVVRQQAIKNGQEMAAKFTWEKAAREWLDAINPKHL